MNVFELRKRLIADYWELRRVVDLGCETIALGHRAAQ